VTLNVIVSIAMRFPNQALKSLGRNVSGSTPVEKPMISRFGFDGSGLVDAASKYFDGTASWIFENLATCACAEDATLRSASVTPAACAAHVRVRMMSPSGVNVSAPDVNGAT
jgi:hypothetical protein